MSRTSCRSPVFSPAPRPSCLQVFYFDFFDFFSFARTVSARPCMRCRINVAGASQFCINRWFQAGTTQPHPAPHLGAKSNPSSSVPSRCLFLFFLIFSRLSTLYGVCPRPVGLREKTSGCLCQNLVDVDATRRACMEPAAVPASKSRWKSKRRRVLFSFPAYNDKSDGGLSGRRSNLAISIHPYPCPRAKHPQSSRPSHVSRTRLCLVLITVQKPSTSL